MKQGFSRFFDNILEHLLKGLAAWMFRGLKSLGIETPTELTLEAAITLVIQVSGVTVELLWQRLAAKIGQEKVDKIREALELAGQAFDFIKDVQERGIEAIWDKISEQLSNLWDLIFDAAKSWIMKEIVNKAIAKVLSMLDPTGIMAVVNSCIAFFKAVQSVLDYMRELLELIDSYVSTVAQIAKGNVGPGAAMLETGLANAVPVAIGFLANQAGLGDVPEQVKQIIIDLRAKIVEAIDWLIDKAISARAVRAERAVGGEEDEDDAADGTGRSTSARRTTTCTSRRTRCWSRPRRSTDPARGHRGRAALLDELSRPSTRRPSARRARRPYSSGTRTIQGVVDDSRRCSIAHPDLWNEIGVGIGHAPDMATSRRTGRRTPARSRPRARSSLPFWMLEAEHVIPDDHVAALFKALAIAATTAGGVRGDDDRDALREGEATIKTTSDSRAREAKPCSRSCSARARRPCRAAMPTQEDGRRAAVVRSSVSTRADGGAVARLQRERAREKLTP